MGFRLVPTSMTLNDTEWRNSPYFAFSHRIRLLCWPITSQLAHPVLSRCTMNDHSPSRTSVYPTSYCCYIL